MGHLWCLVNGYILKNKKSLKSKDDNNISVDKAIKLCGQYHVGLSKQQLKQNSMKELVLIITERVKDGKEAIELKQDTIYTKRATLRFTTKDNGISMNMLSTVWKQNEIAWIKQLPDEYIIEKEAKSTDDLLFDLASRNIPTRIYFVNFF